MKLNFLNLSQECINDTQSIDCGGDRQLFSIQGFRY